MRGWLILIAIGLFLRIGLYVKSLCTDYTEAWDVGQWNVLTVPGSASYDALWAPTLMFELSFTLLFPVLSVLCLILLFQRRKIFPKVMITFLLLVLVFKIFDEVVAGLIPLVAKQQSGVDSDFLRVIFQTIIWVPYLRYSKRVRATFRR